jgi:hypothetical protein
MAVVVFGPFNVAPLRVPEVLFLVLSTDGTCVVDEVCSVDERVVLV